MKWKIDLAYFIPLFISFCFFTVFGTLSHEYGHILIAESLGYDTKLHHASMEYDNDSLFDLYHEMFENNSYEIKHRLPFENQDEFLQLEHKLELEGLLISIGGPAQTLLTSIIGLVLIFSRKLIQKKQKFNALDWLSVFLGLFCLRQLFNLFNSVSSKLLFNEASYFGGDELKIAEGLGVWEGSIAVTTAIFAAIITLFILLKVVPSNLRFTFVLAGINGGLFAFYLWMFIIGPYIIA